MLRASNIMFIGKKSTMLRASNIIFIVLNGTKLRKKTLHIFICVLINIK